MKRRTYSRPHNDNQSIKNNRQNLHIDSTAERKKRCTTLEKMKDAPQKEKIHQENYDRHHHAIQHRNKGPEINLQKQENEFITKQNGKKIDRQVFTDKTIECTNEKRGQFTNNKEIDERFLEIQKQKPKGEAECVIPLRENKKQYPAHLKKDQLNESQKQRIRNLKVTIENSDKIKEDGTIPIKLVLVGDGNVGKTSMLISYTTDNFPTDYVPTVFDNYVADIKIGKDKVKLWLWDTAGQEEYEQLRLISYQKADVFFICFSMIDQNSFYNALNKWFREVHQQCPKAIKIFVGTKYDLHQQYLSEQVNLAKVIPIDYIQKKCAQKKCNFMPCSGLNQKGLNEVFTKAMTTIIERVQRKKKQQSSLCQVI